MTFLLRVREKIKQIYSVYSTVIEPVIQFILAFVVFMQIRNVFGQEGFFGNVFLILVLALVCSLLPLGGTVAAGIFLLLGQCMSIGLEVVLFTAALLILMYAFFLRFTKKNDLVLLLTPLSFSWNIPGALSVGCGLTRSLSSIVPAGCSVIFYYYIDSMLRHADTFRNSDPKMFIGNMKLLSELLLGNKEMIVSLTAVVVSMLVTGWIRKTSSRYAWKTAVVAGTLSYVIVMMAAGMSMNVQVRPAGLAVSAAAAVIVGLVAEFFARHMEGTGIEHLSFEDDEYYYYVKAVPKKDVKTQEKYIKDTKKTDDTDNMYMSAEEHCSQEDVVTSGLSQNTIRFDRSGHFPEDKLSGESEVPVQEPDDEDLDVSDYERRLEESLKNL